jgi:hypothetical protein
MCNIRLHDYLKISTNSELLVELDGHFERKLLIVVDNPKVGMD